MVIIHVYICSCLPRARCLSLTLSAFSLPPRLSLGALRAKCYGYYKQKYTSRDHIHLHRFKKRQVGEADPNRKKTHEYNAWSSGNTAAAPTTMTKLLFILHAIYSYYTVSENGIHILAWICSIRSFHSKTPPNTPTHHIKLDTFQWEQEPANTTKKEQAKSHRSGKHIMYTLVHCKIEHSTLCWGLYRVTYTLWKLHPQSVVVHQQNAKGAKTGSRKKGSEKKLKSSWIEE